MHDNDNDVPMLLCSGLLVALGLLLGGCGGAYREAAYDPGPPGGGHWRPVEPKDAGAILTDLRAAQSQGLPVVCGVVKRHRDLFDRRLANAGERESLPCPYRVLPSGRVASPCWAADLSWEYRSLRYCGEWLVLADRCSVYDEASDTAIWEVVRRGSH